MKVIREQLIEAAKTSQIFLRPDFLELNFSLASVTFSLASVTSTALQLKFVCVTSFLLLGQLRDLSHSKKTSELTLGTLNL